MDELALDTFDDRSCSSPEGPAMDGDMMPFCGMDGGGYVAVDDDEAKRCMKLHCSPNGR